MSDVTAIRHVCFEDLGSFAGVLAERGLSPLYRDAGIDDLAGIDPLAPELLVILGGPIGVTDTAAYPFLRDELALLEQRLAADRPTLGVCLGAQLIARVLGSAVYPGQAREIGWQPLELTAAGLSVPQLRRDSGAHGATFEVQGRRCLADWLSGVGL